MNVFEQVLILMHLLVALAIILELKGLALRGGIWMDQKGRNRNAQLRDDCEINAKCIWERCFALLYGHKFAEAS